MEDEIEVYVKICGICQLDKPERQREAGLLQLLHVAEKSWVFVSMDFISGFPKVNGLSLVLVMVNKFLKYAVFITAPHLCIVEQTTELFF